VVYGAFSAIPVFLVWLYASWSVILVGALIVAELPQSTRA
jgi:membrane protein